MFFSLSLTRAAVFASSDSRCAVPSTQLRRRGPSRRGTCLGSCRQSADRLPYGTRDSHAGPAGLFQCPDISTMLCGMAVRRWSTRSIETDLCSGCAATDQHQGAPVLASERRGTLQGLLSEPTTHQTVPSVPTHPTVPNVFWRLTLGSVTGVIYIVSILREASGSHPEESGKPPGSIREASGSLREASGSLREPPCLAGTSGRASGKLPGALREASGKPPSHIISYIMCI